MNCEVLTAEQPVGLAVLGLFAGKTYFAGTVVSRVVTIGTNLVELWTFAPGKSRGRPGLDEDWGRGGRYGVGGAEAEWVRALSCAGDRTVRVGFESHCRKFRFGTLAIPFTPLCQCLSEETLKAVGPFSQWAQIRIVHFRCTPLGTLV